MKTLRKTIYLTAPSVHVLGDVHGKWQEAEKRIRNTPEGSIILQVGDFGYDPSGNFSPLIPDLGLFGNWPPDWKLGDRRLYWIAGNHEDHSALPKRVKKTSRGVTFIPTGSRLCINGVTALAVSGADTVSWDRGHRTVGKTFFPEEEKVSKEVVDLLLQKLQPGDVQVILSHAAPRKIGLQGIRPDTFEDSRDQLNRLAALDPSAWFFGHYHLAQEGQYHLADSFTTGQYGRFRALAELELVDVSWFFPPTA